MRAMLNVHSDRRFPTPDIDDVGKLNMCEYCIYN